MDILHSLDQWGIGGIQELVHQLQRFSRHRHDTWGYAGEMTSIMREAGNMHWEGGPPVGAHYDVLVGHGVGGWSWNDGARWAHGRGMKFVEVMHSNARSQTDPGLVDGFIAMSHIAAQLNPHMPNRRVIYVIVNAAEFGVRTPLYIGRLSRLVEEKRPWEFSQLAQAFPNEKFILGGDGPEMSRISTGHNLWLPGTVRNFPGFYAALKLYVYPTRDECCCATVAMAQVAGVPVVTQDLPALRETTGGFATFCGDRLEFEHAVRIFLADPDPFWDRAAAGKAWALEHFDAPVTVAAWDHFLETV